MYETYVFALCGTDRAHALEQNSMYGHEGCAAIGGVMEMKARARANDVVWLCALEHFASRVCPSQAPQVLLTILRSHDNMTRTTLAVAAVFLNAFVLVHHHAEARVASHHIQGRSQNATYVIAQNFSNANL